MTGGEKLRIFAKENGISTFAMERRLGKARGYFSQVKNVSSDVLKMACEAFPNLSAEWLLRDKEPMMLSECSQESDVDSKKVEMLTDRLMEAKRRILELEMELELIKNAQTNI